MQTGLVTFLQGCPKRKPNTTSLNLIKSAERKIFFIKFEYKEALETCVGIKYSMRDLMCYFIHCI